MRLGIIGLPLAGKTTVFNALTGAKLPVGIAAGSSRIEVGQGTAEVPDPRLQALSELYQPRKTTPLRFELGDISGLGPQGEVSGELANEFSKWDGLLLVLRAFDSPLAETAADPQRDLELVQGEFMLSDLLRAEGRLERLADERQKGARDRAELDRELALFERAAEPLRQERPLRAAGLAPADLDALRSYGLLTMKPMLVLQNLSEQQPAQQLRTDLPVRPFHAKLEVELTELTVEEAKDFRDEYGIHGMGSNELLQAALVMLNLITFFTAGETEVRAWSLGGGGTALEAAGTIHSDLARGFIRAEVIQWDQLLELGGLPEARQAGLLRAEGRDHPIADGDVVLVRFNV